MFPRDGKEGDLERNKWKMSGLQNHSTNALHKRTPDIPDIKEQQKNPIIFCHELPTFRFLILILSEID